MPVNPIDPRDMTPEQIRRSRRWMSDQTDPIQQKSVDALLRAAPDPNITWGEYAPGEHLRRLMTDDIFRTNLQQQNPKLFAQIMQQHPTLMNTIARRQQLIQSGARDIRPEQMGLSREPELSGPFGFGWDFATKPPTSWQADAPRRSDAPITPYEYGALGVKGWK